MQKCSYLVALLEQLYLTCVTTGMPGKTHIPESLLTCFTSAVPCFQWWIQMTDSCAKLQLDRQIRRKDLPVRYVKAVNKSHSGQILHWRLREFLQFFQRTLRCSIDVCCCCIVIFQWNWSCSWVTESEFSETETSVYSTMCRKHLKNCACLTLSYHKMPLCPHKVNLYDFFFFFNLCDNLCRICVIQIAFKFHF